ncbi:hypothetical protein HYPSUDRAFT_58275 [Hypholoma sublateritium FD-334 SS-4]|uniref:Uncharacterized protein n=1 Tax=Hypholoma sublateritium (strain FD-334 SS-4) TaxID=945553 RepID=A0A0D2NAX9_HYPSF|nr:hypothetical protein HYPSUDRAFT_58275 [Hypholoma sublateritium FD-334 SS-4]
MASTRSQTKANLPKLRGNRSSSYSKRRGTKWVAKKAHKSIEQKWSKKTTTIEVNGDSILGFVRVKTDSNAVKHILETEFPDVNTATLPRAPETGKLQYVLKETEATPEGLPPNLVMRFDNVIKPRINDLVVKAWDEVLNAGLTFPKADPNRSATPALHLGAWSINQSKPIITAHSRAPAQSKEAEIAIDKFLKIINKYVAPMVTTFFKNEFPVQYGRQQRAHEHVSHKLREEFTKRPELDFGGAFFTVAVKEGSSERIHIDFNDDIKNVAFVVPFGDFTGADLCLPQLNTRVPISAGQVVAFDAKLLAHCSSPIISGRRIILTLFTDYVTLKRYGQ